MCKDVEIVMDDKGQEPSMEDILASIRKILSEDEEAEAASGQLRPQRKRRPLVMMFWN